MRYICLYFLSACIRQIAYPDSCIGKGKGAYDFVWFFIQPITIGFAQQLLGKTKTIISKELVYVKVSTIEAIKFLWLIDGKQ